MAGAMYRPSHITERNVRQVYDEVFAKQRLETSSIGPAISSCLAGLGPYHADASRYLYLIGKRHVQEFHKL